MEQLLLVTSCDWPAGIGASLRTDERTNERTDEQTNGWTDRRGVGNSVLDFTCLSMKFQNRDHATVHHTLYACQINMYTSTPGPDSH